MTIVLGIISVLGFCLGLCYCIRRIRSICRVRRMEVCEKVGMLNEILEPFGFSYVVLPDIITSRQNAWQREFGYRGLFDKTAAHFHMVFDCEPIYFHYDNKTWLVELWKGQYGINIGGEVGVYYTDEILPPEAYEEAHFQSVPDKWLLPIAMEMYYNGDFLFGLKRRHWWLTGFRMGSFAEPENLAMKVMITFPDEEMLGSFVKSLYHRGYSSHELCVQGESVWLTFSIPHSLQPRRICSLRNCFAQWKNRILCKMYRWLTRPFTCTVDQLLYLYFCLPFCARRMLRFRKNRCQKCRRRRCRGQKVCVKKAVCKGGCCK